MCSGLKSNSTQGSRAMLTAIDTPKVQSTALRRVTSSRSTGASSAKPTSPAAQPGLSNVTSAGSTVTLNASATTMPMPEITPSSAIPT